MQRFSKLTSQDNRNRSIAGRNSAYYTQKSIDSSKQIFVKHTYTAALMLSQYERRLKTNINKYLPRALTNKLEEEKKKSKIELKRMK